MKGSCAGCLAVSVTILVIIMARTIVRKCSICKELIDISSDSNDFFIEEKNEVRKTYHCNCYINWQTNKKRGAKTVNECNKYIFECRKKVNSSKKEKNIKNQLYDFISDMYDMSYFPTHFFIKFNEVFTGKYKGLKKPVPPEDLLDMWQQKKKYLLRVADKNKKNGKEITGIGRIWYDLAILLSRYDRYLEWKEEQKNALVDKVETENNCIEVERYKEATTRKIKNSSLSNGIDINSMLDEI